MTKDTKPTGLDILRQPFPPHQISKLPKPTRAQTEAVKQNFKDGIRCDVCGGWHHPKVVHLDYVGHAALTDRLLDADPEWNWEPLALDERGLPAFSKDGLWIKLTVCGVSRLGFGHADGKTGGDAVKEIIGDALRNAAMRFGAALDLWHKGPLHDDADPPLQQADERDEERAADTVKERTGAIGRIMSASDLAALRAVWASLPPRQQNDPEIQKAKAEAKAVFEKPKALVDDEIPY